MSRDEAIALLSEKIARRELLNQPGNCELRANKAPILAVSLTMRDAKALLVLLETCR